MLFAINQYQKFWLSCVVFIGFGLVAVVTYNFYFLLFPFAFLVFSFYFKKVISKTETLFWLLIFCLPLSTELQVTSSLSLDFPTEPLMMLLSFFSVLHWLQKPSTFPKNLLTSNLFFLCCLHFLWVGVCCIYSTMPFLPVKYFLAKTWYIIPFVVLPQIWITQEQQLKKLGWLLLLPMLFVCLQTLIRHSFYGFSFESIKYTLSPFFRNHVNYSGMLVCLLPIAFVLIQNSKLKIQNIYLLNIIYSIFLLALYFAFSRGAWLALVAGLITMWLVKTNLLHWVLSGIGILVVAFCIKLSVQNNYLKLAPDFNTTVFHKNFNDHLQATIALKDVSNAERFYRWVAGVKMIAERPLTGFGPNSFYYNYKHYAAETFKTWVSNNPDHSTVHNYFLLLAIEQGLPGMIIFLILYVSMLLTAQKIYHSTVNKKHQTIAMIIVVTLAMIGVLNFLSDLIETDKIGSLFWLCLGLLIWLKTKMQTSLL